MAGIYEDITKTVGNTPLVRLNKLVKGISAKQVLVKLESFNPLSSVKDRIGVAMVEDPTLVLRALTLQRATFTLQDLGDFLRYRTDGAEQFDAVYDAVTHCGELVALPAIDDKAARFTSRDMIDAEKSLKARLEALASRRGHGNAFQPRDGGPALVTLSPGRQRALDYLLSAIH